MLYENNWTVCKQINSGWFLNTVIYKWYSYKLCGGCVCICKHKMTLNSPLGLKWHKIQQNKTLPLQRCPRYQTKLNIVVRLQLCSSEDCWIPRHCNLFHRHSVLKSYGSIYGKIRGSLNKFPDFFRLGTFIDSTHMKLLSLRSNHLRLQCICCTVPTTFGRPHWSSLVCACQLPWSQPLSFPQLSHNDSL